MIQKIFSYKIRIYHPPGSGLNVCSFVTTERNIIPGDWLLVGTAAIFVTGFLDGHGSGDIMGIEDAKKRSQEFSTDKYEWNVKEEIKRLRSANRTPNP